MCVIVYKPAGAAMPSRGELRACWERNPDGAGLMYPQGGKVRLSKGFMTWEAFEEALREAEEGADLAALPVALHFRIATHGGVAPGLCHPFPVRSDYAAMRRGSALCEVGFMHNGTLSGLRTGAGVSDSMAFAASVLAPLRGMCGDLLADERAARVVGATAQGSRFLLMDGGGAVRRFGAWEASGGAMYSNLAHLSAPLAGAGLLDAYLGFSGVGAELAALGLYPPCAGCPMAPECAEALPYCADERDAAAMAAGFAP